MIKLVLTGSGGGDPVVTAYLDNAGLDALIDRLGVLRGQGGHIHLTDLLDRSATPTGRPTISEVDVVLMPQGA
jgi:hypothetical protein